MLLKLSSTISDWLFVRLHGMVEPYVSHFYQTNRLFSAIRENLEVKNFIRELILYYVYL